MKESIIFGKNLRSIRLQMGYSQGDLQRLTGFPRSCLSRWETGYVNRNGYRSSPSAGTLRKLADVLNVSIAELLRDHEASVREAIPGLSEPDVELLAGVAPCLPGLNETKRKLLLEMIRGFAEVRA